MSLYLWVKIDPFHDSIRGHSISLVFPVKKEYLSNSKKIIFSGFSCIVAVIISVSITTSYQVLFFFYMISFFEMPLPSQETDWWCTYICVLMVIGFAYRMFLWFIHYILELVWWCTCICVLGVIELVWWCTCICVLGVIELVWWCTCICVLRVIDFRTSLMVYMYMCVKGYRFCLCFNDLYIIF